jgi:hypothetical protein
MLAGTRCMFLTGRRVPFARLSPDLELTFLAISSCHPTMEQYFTFLDYGSGTLGVSGTMDSEKSSAVTR